MLVPSVNSQKTQSAHTDPKIIFYDLETTGLNTTSDRIVEIGAVEEKTLKTFHSLINPEKKISYGAFKIHKIKYDDIKDKKTFKEVAPEFINFCTQNAILIAHNGNRFDHVILKRQLKESHIKIPEKWQFEDSLIEARKYLPHLSSHKLTDLQKYFEVKNNNQHRALDDAIALKKIFQKIKECKNKFPPFSQEKKRFAN